MTPPTEPEASDWATAATHTHTDFNSTKQKYFNAGFLIFRKNWGFKLQTWKEKIMKERKKTFKILQILFYGWNASRVAQTQCPRDLWSQKHRKGKEGKWITDQSSPLDRHWNLEHVQTGSRPFHIHATVFEFHCYSFYFFSSSPAPPRPLPPPTPVISVMQIRLFLFVD